MIKLEIKGCCHNCPYIELKRNYKNFKDGRDGLEYEIGCIHEAVCSLIKEEQMSGFYERDKRR